ncbi:MAG: tetratricopeptide repeat protein [Candidatus Puniceispirillum sp.]|jgi:hypothetical protein
MADIFDEVDEDLKRDQMQVLWARYGKYLMIAVSLVVLGVAARQGYQAWQANQAEAAAAAYHSATQQDDVAAALAKVKDSFNPGYKMLAAFRSAAALGKKGDLEAAESAYLALAEDKDVGTLYQQAALLLSVMNAPKNRDVAALRSRLAGLEGAAGPWQAMALEQSAGLALREGDRKTALEKYEALVNVADIPPQLRQRASQMVKILKG